MHTNECNNYNIDVNSRSKCASAGITTTKTSCFVPLAPTHPLKAHFLDEYFYIPEDIVSGSEENITKFDKRGVVVIDTEYDRGNSKEAKIHQIGWKSKNILKQYYTTAVRHIKTNYLFLTDPAVAVHGIGDFQVLANGRDVKF